MYEMSAYQNFSANIFCGPVEWAVCDFQYYVLRDLYFDEKCSGVFHEFVVRSTQYYVLAMYHANFVRRDRNDVCFLNFYYLFLLTFRVWQVGAGFHRFEISANFVSTVVR